MDRPRILVDRLDSSDRKLGIVRHKNRLWTVFLEMKIFMTIKIFLGFLKFFSERKIFSLLWSARICCWVEEVEDLKADEIKSLRLHYCQWNQAGQVFGKSRNRPQFNGYFYTGHFCTGIFGMTFLENNLSWIKLIHNLSDSSSPLIVGRTSKKFSRILFQNKLWKSNINVSLDVCWIFCHDTGHELTSFSFQKECIRMYHRTAWKTRTFNFEF